MAALRRVGGGGKPAKRGGLVRHSPYHYSVPSSSTGRKHAVVRSGDSWHCTCLSYGYRHGTCKHIAAVKAAFDTAEPAGEPSEPVVVRHIEQGTCPKCGSANSKKDGVRYNKKYKNQKYKCRDCGNCFSANAGMGNTVLPPERVIDVMQLSASGLSYAKIEAFLATKRVRVCVKTVCNIVRRFSKILIEYCDQLRPRVSEAWRSDEKHVKSQDGQSWAHTVMDNATRFALAAMLAPKKGEGDVSEVFVAAAVRAGKVPHMLISDASKSIHAAWKRCYRARTKRQKSTAHASSVHLAGNMNNNMMERFNRELGERVHGARFVSERAVVDMVERARLFYNFFHKHSGLGDRTPAEAAGIAVEGDKWTTLLRNAHAWKLAG